MSKHLTNHHDILGHIDIQNIIDDKFTVFGWAFHNKLGSREIRIKIFYSQDNYYIKNIVNKFREDVANCYNIDIINCGWSFQLDNHNDNYNNIYQIELEMLLNNDQWVTFYTFTKTNFITFGGDSENYHNAVLRLTNQANSLKVFNKVTGYTEKDLMEDTEFWNNHGDFIQNNRRGYGYWLWKSYLIKKTMKKINEGEILLYLDSGCEFSPECESYIANLIAETNQKLILFTTTPFIEKIWTKGHLLKHFNVYDDPKFTDTPQLQAGLIILKKCSLTVNLIDEWYNLGCNYSLINDVYPENCDNLPGFIDHRHDQSIFSLLIKKYCLTENISKMKGINIARNRS